MNTAGDDVNNSQDRSKHIGILALSLFMLLFGFLMTVGFLSTPHGSETKSVDLADMFLSFMVLIFLYGLPSIFIVNSIRALRAHFQLRVLIVVTTVLFGAAVFAGGTIMKMYNAFVQLDENVNQAFANVETAYQRRFNLIGNLDTASRRYASHERAVIQDIVNARKSIGTAPSTSEKMSVYGQFDSATRALVINIEQYPNLKADAVVQTLMTEMSATENELLELKTTYNTKVVEYNKTIRTMPFG